MIAEANGSRGLPEVETPSRVENRLPGLIKNIQPDASFNLLHPQEKALIDAVALVANRFIDRAEYYDERAEFPKDNFKELHEVGVLGLLMPEKYGGLEVRPLVHALILKEIAKRDAATALALCMHLAITKFISVIGTAEEQNIYLPLVIKNGSLFLSGTTGPETSFRKVGKIGTKFQKLPDGKYIISGEKEFGSIGDASTYIFVSGVDTGYDNAADGFISAMVPTKKAKFVPESWQKYHGMRATNSQTFILDSVVVEPDAIIGTPGQIPKELLFDIFPFEYAAVYTGIAEAALNYTVEELEKLESKKPGLSEDKQTKEMLANMIEMVLEAQTALREAAEASESGDKIAFRDAANKAKLYAGIASENVPIKGNHILGARYMYRGNPLERWRRDGALGPLMPPSEEKCKENLEKLSRGENYSTLNVTT